MLTYANKLRHHTRRLDDAFEVHIMDATEVLDATGDLPRPVTAPSSADDVEVASAGAVVGKVEEAASSKVLKVVSCDQQMVLAAEPTAGQFYGLRSNTEAGTSAERLPTAEVAGSTDTPSYKRLALCHRDTRDESDSIIGTTQ